MIDACALVVALALVSTCAFAAASSNQGADPPPIAAGPFGPGSLTAYACPKWFRDAKLGIWSHWGPQAVPMAGDWYARNMYIQGSRQYEHHLANYGHPTEHGWKDVIPLWQAEKWDPDRLMQLYKKAGARYFVSMACHHDNFDLWNSRHNRWNAVQMGPRKDVVGIWQKAARKQGLRFGVSEHLGASFTWYQVSRGADKEGPLAGKPYDGADPRFEDLYHFPAEPGDTGWYTTNPRYHRQWFERIRDLVDSYKPDLLYTDGGVPFGNAVGLSMIAHYYNADAARRGGKPEVVYTCKEESQGRWVEDLERGVMPGVRPHPWQTDTSIGDWYYNKDWKYRGADWVIHMLADIVSKNGNLLLNVVQRPDGSLDPEAEQVLEEMAEWMSVNGEAIYGTRPWTLHGEGPVRARGGNFAEDFAYTARDVRYTTKGSRTLYAIILGWPDDGRVSLRALARAEGVTGKVTDVRLLGSAAHLEWTHAADALYVRFVGTAPCRHAVVLKIACTDLRKFRPELALPQQPVVRASTDGGFVLNPDDAQTHGGQIRVEQHDGIPNIGFWDRPDEWVSWKVAFAAPGSYRVIADCGTVHAGIELSVDAGGDPVTAAAPVTGAWNRFERVELGVLTIPEAGERAVAVRPRDPGRWKAINLRSIRLEPVRSS